MNIPNPADVEKGRLFWLKISVFVFIALLIEVGASYLYVDYLPDSFKSNFLFLAVLNLLTIILLIALGITFGRILPQTRIPKQISSLNKYYHKALDQVRDGIFILGKSGKITYTNPSLCRYHGYNSKDELEGRNWSVLYDETHQKWLEQHVFPSLEKHEKWSGHTKGSRLDGSLFDQELTFLTLECGGLMGIMQDISRRIEAEHEAENRLVAIEASEDGIGIVNARGILIFINKALMDIHGIREDERGHFIGRHWENLYPKKGRKYVKDNVMPEFERLGSWRGESPIQKLTGEVTHAELSLTKTPDGGMIGTARDITHKKKNELEKAQLKEQFYQAQKMEAIGRLAGGIAHDFNNILAAIMGYSEFLLEDLKKGTSEHDFARHIHSAGFQARDLVDQMLAFSRRSESASELMDITTAVEKTYRMINSSLPKTIKVKTHFDIDHPFIMGNETQIGQVLMNMAVNSKDAMGDEKAGILEIRLEDWDPESSSIQSMLSDRASEPNDMSPPRIREHSSGKVVLQVGHLSPKKNYARITVSDTGCGITKSVAEHIFEPFYTTKDVNKGTGLGMSMTHGVVMEHSGALFMESIPEQGTRFEIFFPLVDDSDIDFVDEEEQAPGRDKGSGEILVIEDQENIRIMLSKMLERMGYEVTLADEPGMALEILNLKQGSFDVVITDYTMPGMTGLDLAKKMADLYPELPVIMISGYAHNRLEKARLSASNIRAVFKKPVKSEQIFKSLAEILD